MAVGLISQNDVKTLLGIDSSDSSEDDKIDLLIAAASAAVEAFCHREFEAQERTEYLDGSGWSDLILKHRPVNSIASVQLDANGYYGEAPDAFPAETTLTAGVDYVLPKAGHLHSRSGLLKRIGGSSFASGGVSGGRRMGLRPARRGPIWPHGTGNIKVVYNAGYAEIPADIQQAVFTLIAWMRRSGPMGGAAITGETLGEYTYSIGQLTNAATSALSTVGEMGSVRQLLSQYLELTL